MEKQFVKGPEGVNVSLSTGIIIHTREEPRVLVELQ
jgi:hypothetical protein